MYELSRTTAAITEGDAKGACRRMRHFCIFDSEQISPQSRTRSPGQLRSPMAPTKRRKMSATPEPTSGNTTKVVRTRRSPSARGRLHDAPDADLDAEPEVLLCPITRTMFLSLIHI